jgi:hypothetical protein
MEPVAELGSLRFLLGTWRGGGRGDYPTIEPFTYEEEISFTHVGKPFIAYAQRTWTPDGRPLHTESGYVRPVGTDGVELVLAQPTGITEIHSGSVDGCSVRLISRHVGVSPTAKDVRAVTRSLWVEGDTLRYRLEMEAVDQPLQFHLEAELARA